VGVVFLTFLAISIQGNIDEHQGEKSLGGDQVSPDHRKEVRVEERKGTSRIVKDGLATTTVVLPMEDGIGIITAAAELFREGFASQTSRGRRTARRSQCSIEPTRVSKQVDCKFKGKRGNGTVHHTMDVRDM